MALSCICTCMMIAQEVSLLTPFIPARNTIIMINNYSYSLLRLQFTFVQIILTEVMLRKKILTHGTHNLRKDGGNTVNNICG